MPNIELTEQLKSLKLNGILEQLLEQEQTQRQAPLGAQDWLMSLLQAEAAKRLAKSISYQLGIAKFPYQKRIEQFDFNQTPVDSDRVYRQVTRVMLLSGV